MSRLVLVLLLCASVLCEEQPSVEREEKLRTALIDAFQNIKKASAKGGVDDEGPLTADLIGSILIPNISRERPPAQEESSDLFSDDDGLTFAEAFGEVENSSKRTASSEKSHNVQHIVKSAKDKTTQRPNKDSILLKISDSIRNAVNETKNTHLKRESPSNESSYTGIDSMLRILDAEVLTQQWRELQREVAGACRQQLQDYVDGLKQKKLWALKMDDAGGRYTSMFYWGNNYWMGSQELCAELNARDLAPRKNNSSGSQIFSDWRGDISSTDDGPPFPTAYFTARLAIDLDASIAENRRTIYLGLCLPRSCDKASVRRLLSSARSPHLRHSVLAVRAPLQNEYQYLHDPTFQMLLASVCIVTALLVAGTAYDLKLTQDARKRRRRAENMAAVENGGNNGEKGALEAISVSKGKSMYNVNNNIANLSEERLTGENSSTHEEELKLSVWSELLLSFSARANILQIFDQSVGSDTVSVLHGLRTFSMIWVIFGHTCIVVFKYADNTALRAVLEQSFWFQLVISAVYSVDTFFCLGGVLVTFLYFRTNAKGNLDRLTKGRRKLTAGALQFIGLLAYRFARLTAPYLFMLGVVEVTMKWFAANAVFEPPAADHLTCPHYWWRNLLYVNTLFPVDQMCMLWSWYISDDTQFYAVSSVVLILATTHLKSSAILAGFLFLSSLMTTGYVSWSAQHIPTGEDPFTQFDKIYDKPWTRFGPYLVGMATGWILFKTNLRIPMNRLWVGVGWTVSTCTLLFLIFGLYGSQLGVLSAAVFSALSHSLWAAAVGWIIIACSTGHGGWVHRLLSSPRLYPLSRTTYCAYLVHPVVLRALAAALSQPLHLSETLVFVLFLGVSVISYFLAFTISVAFEAPVVTMLKILSPQKKPRHV